MSITQQESFNPKNPHHFFNPEFIMGPENKLNYYQEATSLYYLKDVNDLLVSPFNYSSGMANKITHDSFSAFSYSVAGRHISATLEMLERSTHRYLKPSFGISQVISSEEHIYEINEEIIDVKPFCNLIHFKRQRIHSEFSKNINEAPLQKILVVAPYSGHYATLLRDTVAALLKDHEVYITDWQNARDVPLTMGSFTLEDYIQYLIDFVHKIGPRINILAVCQPSVPVLAMCSLMATFEDPCQPQSMILMGGPIDTRVNPTKVNELAKEKSLEWFERTVISRVPHYYTGALRRVCPGFILLAGFMSLNLNRHFEANTNLFKLLTQGDEESAEAHRRFYNEYRSVLDLPADYYLDSIQIAFQTHALPLGTMFWQGEKITPSSIRKTALMTVEGEKDDISGVGQTYAAHALCPNIPESHKHHHLQKGVGHYGVFNGRRWRDSIVPAITKFIINSTQL
jgi:poly(3-hydroxybutyrate) depolymerase